ERGRRHRPIAEPADEGEVSGHHGDLAELGQRHRRGEADRLRQLSGEGVFRRCHSRRTLDLVERSHGTKLAGPLGEIEAAGLHEKGWAERGTYQRTRSGTRVILAPSAFRRSSMRS